jgi:DNA-binding GntR family transcriptional regulator
MMEKGALSETGRTHSEVYEALKRQILTFSMPPGEKLSESILSAQMNAGRPMVRDVLAQLAEEGYIVVYPQKGTAVTALQPERIRQAVHTHIVLEQAVIEEICKKGLTDEQSEKLEQLLLEQKGITGKDEAIDFIIAEQQMHYMLASFCGREYMWNVFRTMDCDLLRINYLQYSTFNYNAYMSSLTSWEHTQVEGRMLADNLRRQDGEAAQLLCASHYNSVLLNMGSLQAIYPQFFSG